MQEHIKISRTRNKQFKATTIGSNGEPLSVTENIINRQDVFTNLVAQLKLFNGNTVLIQDKTVTPAEWYNLYPTGEKFVTQPANS